VSGLKRRIKWYVDPDTCTVSASLFDAPVNSMLPTGGTLYVRAVKDPDVPAAEVVAEVQRQMWKFLDKEFGCVS
jgi:hypothetical protein